MKSTGRPTGRPPSTEHGTYGYGRRHKCRCEPCRKAINSYQKGYNVDRARGIKRKVSAAPARRHLQGLLDAGYTAPQIYKAAGIVDAVFDNIMVGTQGRGPAEEIHRTTAVRIMTITPEALGEVRVLLPTVGLRRRYEALAYMGHSPANVAAELGISVAALYQYLKSKDSFAQTIWSFHEVYVRLRDTQGDSGFNRWKAYRLGWAPPLAWDDELIDDPTAAPFGSSCVVAQCTRPATRRNLCSSHDPRVPETEAKYYRTYVLRMSREKTKDPKRLRAELTDLKRAGYNMEAACNRIGAGLTYVEKFWGSL